jgi:hypothetical protein
MGGINEFVSALRSVYVLLYYELTPFAIRREGDDAIVIFGATGVWTIQEWSHNMTDINIREFSINLEI